MPDLLIGPMLRYVDETSASIWVETSEPCEVAVAVAGTRATDRTFTLHGHHYAIVDVEGTGAYSVELDGRPVWPVEGYPHSRICPLEELNKVVFGSCRTTVPHDDEHTATHGVDVLREYGRRLIDGEDAARPAALPRRPGLRRRDRPRRCSTSSTPAARHRRPPDESSTSRSTPSSTGSPGPTRSSAGCCPPCRRAMIFDDHDVRDDWNTSQVVARADGRRRRGGASASSAGLGVVLGLPAPGQPVAVRAQGRSHVRARSTGAATDGAVSSTRSPTRADEEPTSTRWSYTRDFGTTRLSWSTPAAARVLDPGTPPHARPRRDGLAATSKLHRAASTTC